MVISSKAAKWINSYSSVCKWFKQFDFSTLQQENNSVLKLNNFFPVFVAEAILQQLENLRDSDWNLSKTEGEYEAEHSFRKGSNNCMRKLDSVFRVFAVLFPDHVPSFNAAKYQKSDQIAEHDDRAYIDVTMNDSGRVEVCSRDITLVYYLTKDWTEAMGGAFVDLQDNVNYVPEFNSAVLFKVPHLHMVEPVLVNCPRYTIFGWFLKPGKLYPLQDDESNEKDQRDVRMRSCIKRIVGLKRKKWIRAQIARLL